VLDKMKKIVITGHTSGIGKSIHDKLSKEKYDVVGLSRSNGFDLKSKEGYAHFVNAIEDADIFINNAYHEWAQVDLLYLIYEKWQHTNKTIINISSVTGDSSKKHIHQYQIHKLALDNACMQLQPLGKCKVINIKPGWVDTNFNPNKSIPKEIEILQPEKIAELVEYVLNQPNQVFVKSISIEPWYND
tara:strand:+ start:674 stop:1237 length:564 start_codon:yes stop_codon:yes gene_type:complete